MSRTNNLFKVTFNAILDHIAELGKSTSLPNALQLSHRFGVSRTTIVTALDHLDSAGIVKKIDKRRTIVRLPRADEYFPVEETIASTDRATNLFLEYAAAHSAKGEAIRETDLVRIFGETSYAVRNALQHFARLGIVRKEPNRHWLFEGIGRDLLVELYDAQELIEGWAIKKLSQREMDSAEVQHMESVQLKHLRALRDPHLDQAQYYEIDAEFHGLLVDLAKNRFFSLMFDSVRLFLQAAAKLPIQETVDYRSLLIENMAILASIAAKRETEALEQLRAHNTRSKSLMLSARELV